MFTQGKYYTYDGSRDTAKSIAYAKELEKLGTDGYNYAHVVVKNGRISVARLIKDTEIGEEIVNGAAIYNTATDQWNQSAFRVSEQRENENLGDIVTDKLSEKGWSVFLSGATNSSIDDSKLNGYYIKVNQEMKYLSPADNSVEDTNRSVDRINSMLEAMGVITTRRPVSFDNTTENYLFRISTEHYKDTLKIMNLWLKGSDNNHSGYAFTTEYHNLTIEDLYKEFGPIFEAKGYLCEAIDPEMTISSDSKYGLPEAKWKGTEYRFVKGNTLIRLWKGQEWYSDFCITYYDMSVVYKEQQDIAAKEAAAAKKAAEENAAREEQKKDYLRDF